MSPVSPHLDCFVTVTACVCVTVFIVRVTRRYRQGQKGQWLFYSRPKPPPLSCIFICVSDHRKLGVARCFNHIDITLRV